MNGLDTPNQETPVSGHFRFHPKWGQVLSWKTSRLWTMSRIVWPVVTKVMKRIEMVNHPRLDNPAPDLHHFVPPVGLRPDWTPRKKIILSWLAHRCLLVPRKFLKVGVLTTLPPPPKVRLPSWLGRTSGVGSCSSLATWRTVNQVANVRHGDCDLGRETSQGGPDFTRHAQLKVGRCLSTRVGMKMQRRFFGDAETTSAPTKYGQEIFLGLLLVGVF